MAIRVRFACAGSVQVEVRHVGLKDLNGVVNRVSAKDRTMVGIVDDEPHLAVGMARQRYEPKARGGLMAVIDEIGEPCLDDWNDVRLQPPGVDRRHTPDSRCAIQPASSRRPNR